MEELLENINGLVQGYCSLTFASCRHTGSQQFVWSESKSLSGGQAPSVGTTAEATFRHVEFGEEGARGGIQAEKPRARSNPVPFDVDLG